MLMILIDAFILIALLKVINDDEIELLTAGIVALVTSIGTSALAYALASAMGVWGIVVAGVVAAAGLGIAVSSLFGVEIKRSMLIGFIFMILHIGIGVSISLAFAM